MADLWMVPVDLLPGVLDGWTGPRVRPRCECPGDTHHYGGCACGARRASIRVDTRRPEVRDHLIRHFDAGMSVDLSWMRDRRGGLEPWVSAALLWCSAHRVAGGRKPVRVLRFPWAESHPRYGMDGPVLLTRNASNGDDIVLGVHEDREACDQQQLRQDTALLDDADTLRLPMPDGIVTVRRADFDGGSDG